MLYVLQNLLIEKRNPIYGPVHTGGRGEFFLSVFKKIRVRTASSNRFRPSTQKRSNDWKTLILLTGHTHLPVK